MNLRIIILSIVVMTIPVSVNAQTARNPLNHEPANVTLKKQISSWKLSDEIFYRADGKQFEKRCFNYDENGKAVSEVSFSWSISDNTWRETSKRTNYYTDNKETVITSTLNFSSPQNTSKVEIVYDTKKKPVYSLTYYWNSDADDWFVNPFLKCEWEYDGMEKMIAYRKQYMNQKTNKWNDFDARILYAYDEAGALTDEVYQSWNPEQSTWINRGKYTYSNNGEQQKVATSFIFVSDKWLLDGKTIYSYDEEGKLARSDYFSNNTDNSRNAYSLYTYSDGVKAPVSVESKDIAVYPNPAVSSFELVVPEEYLGKVMYLFDASGNQVKSNVINNPTTRIDVANLSNGIYFLKIGDASKTIFIN